MKKTQTDLVDFLINPAFLELIGVPPNDFQIALSLSFYLQIENQKFYISVSGSESGEVTIRESGRVGLETVIRDYCETPVEFKDLIDRLKDMVKRFPKKEE